MKFTSRRVRAGLVGLALVPALTLGAAGCGGGPGGGDNKSLTYWSMWKVGEPQQEVLAQAVKDFQQQTGITVNVQWQGRNNLQKVVPALNTNTVPDLIDGPYLKAYPALVATDQALGLQSGFEQPVGDATAATVIPKDYLDFIDIKLPDGQPWMMPYSLTSEAVWFDAAQHPEFDKNPPRTWDDFVSAMNKLKSEGKTPMASDGDISGYNANYLTALLVRSGGPGTLKKIAEDKTGEAWKDPQVLAAAEKVEKLATGNYLLEGYGASKFPAQQQQWANDKAAFMFNGSWLPTESAPYAAKSMKFASFPFPSTGKDQSARVDFSGFMVPKKAQNPQAAQQFGAFFLQSKYQDALGTEAKVLPVRTDAKVAPQIASVQQSIKKATTYYQQNDGVAFPGYNEKVYWPNDDQLFLGKVTARQFVDKMAADQADYWKSQR